MLQQILIQPTNYVSIILSPTNSAQDECLNGKKMLSFDLLTLEGDPKNS